MQTVASFRILLVGSKVLAHVRPSFPALLYLFPGRLSFCTVFYGSPSLCLYGAIGKYTTSRLIISRLVERSHFLLCGPRCERLKNSTDAAGKQSSLWPSHSSDAAAHHMFGPGSGSAGLKKLCRGFLRVCVSGEEAVVGSDAGSPASSSRSFSQDTFLLAE